MPKPKDYAIPHKEAKKLPEYVPEDKKNKRPAYLSQVTIDGDYASFVLHFYKDTNPDYLYRIKTDFPLQISRDSKGRAYVDLPKWRYGYVSVSNFSKTGKRKFGDNSFIVCLDKCHLDAVVKWYIDSVFYDELLMSRFQHEWYMKQCKGGFIYHMNLV